MYYIPNENYKVGNAFVLLQNKLQQILFFVSLPLSCSLSGFVWLKNNAKYECFSMCFFLFFLILQLFARVLKCVSVPTKSSMHCHNYVLWCGVCGLIECMSVPECVCACVSLYKATHNSSTIPDVLIFNEMVGINPMHRCIFSLNILVWKKGSMHSYLC